MRDPRCTVAALVAAMLMAGASPAGAQTQSSQSAAAAEALFDAALGLMKEGKHAEACPKLEESQRLDPSMGTVAWLAECYEKTGRTASAWLNYVTVANGDSDPQRLKIARARVKELERVLPRLVVIVPEAVAALAGFEVSRDGTPLGKPQWSVAIPVDPGEHTVRASANGKVAWTSTVQVNLKQRLDVAVPPLADAPIAAPPPVASPPPVNVPPPIDRAPPPLPEPQGRPGQQTAALVIGGAGLAGIVVGGVFGGLAASQWSSAKEAAQRGCADKTAFRGCTQAAKDAQVKASTFANVSTAAFTAGGVMVAGALILWLTAPSRPRPAARVWIVPAVGPGVGALQLEGTL